MCRHEVCTLALALVHGNLEPLVHLWAAVHVHLDVDVDRHVRVLLHGICLLTDLLGRLSGICLLTNLLGRLSGMLLRIPAATTVANGVKCAYGMVGGTATWSDEATAACAWNQSSRPMPTMARALAIWSISRVLVITLNLIRELLPPGEVVVDKLLSLIEVVLVQ